MDYGFVSDILAFDKCETRRCTEMPIVNDTIVESTESFFVTLERTPGLDSRITLNPVIGEVEIVENNGMYFLSFWSTYYCNHHHWLFNTYVLLCL